MDKQVWHILTAPGTSFVRLFAKPTLPGAPPLGRSVGSLGEWEAQVPFPKSYNVYAHLNPTRNVKRLRANADDTAKWGFLLVDMDPLGDYVPAQADALRAIQQVQDSLAAQVHPGFADAAVIYSGRGAQLWVRLTPLVIQPGDSATVQKIGNACNRFLSSIESMVPSGYRIDTTGDLARIARLPGSRNQKTQRRAELIEGGYIAPPSLSDTLLKYYQPVHYVGCGNLGREPSPMHDWRDAQDHMTLRAKNFIWFGEDEGDRHASLHHCCKTMWELGVSIGSANEALKMGAQASRPPLTQADVMGVLKQVYSKGEYFKGKPCSTNCTCSPTTLGPTSSGG